MRQNDAAGAWILEPRPDGRLHIGGVVSDRLTSPLDDALELSPAIERWVAQVRASLSTWDGSGPMPLVREHPFHRASTGLALPIVSDGQFYGVLRFVSRAPQRRITAGQIKSLDILASTAASALATASLVNQLRGLNQDLERRVVERTRDLAASNADLEAFSYSVSHDLRAPLRAVEGFCEIFIRNYGQDLTPDGRGVLDKVMAGARRMHRLIDDLLHLARFSRQPLQTQTVQLADIVRRVAQTLEQQMQGRDVELSVGELPPCQGDPALLEHVITNLLSNALKFTAGRSPARIAVGTLRFGPEQAYYVRDNGVGFDMKYAERLFGVFQRLHTQEQFPGTGIGLSIVQRIIKRHGGRAWAEAKLGEGATIYFTLPVAT
jgi:signal transduction histidine kinase